MSSSHDQRAAAHQDAGRIADDLNRMSGLLEEVATVWRRAGLYGPQSSPITPGHLQEAARSLANLLRTLAYADSEQYPALAFSAAEQTEALERDAALCAAVTATGGRRLGDGDIWTAIQDALRQIRKQLWDL